MILETVWYNFWKYDLMVTSLGKVLDLMIVFVFFFCQKKTLLQSKF